MERSCNKEALRLSLPPHLIKQEEKGKEKEEEKGKWEGKGGERRAGESTAENREKKAPYGRLCVSHRSTPSPNNLSERSLGRCGNIIPDWGLRDAEKACHYRLWVYC